MDVAQINSKKGYLVQIQASLRKDPTLVNLLTYEGSPPLGDYSHLTDNQLIFIGYVSKVTDLPLIEFGLEPSHCRIREVLGSRGLL